MVPAFERMRQVDAGELTIGYYKSAKWLSGIEVTAEVEQGYWEDYGYPVDGWLPGEEPVDA